MLCDVDLGSDLDGHWSTSGYYKLFGPILSCGALRNRILWLISNIEAEYRSLALANGKLMNPRSLLCQPGVLFAAPTIYYDNLSSISLADIRVLYLRTKHMEFDIHFIREKVCNNTLCMSQACSHRFSACCHLHEATLSTSIFSLLRDKLTVNSFKPP